MQRRASFDVGNKRLLELVEKLMTVPDHQFNYSCWLRNYDANKGFDCGTVGCALGWAASMPQFNKLGFRAVQPYDSSYTALILNYRGQERHDFEAAELLFHLTERQASRLFAPREGEHAATAKQVAAKIRRFVCRRKTNGKK